MKPPSLWSHPDAEPLLTHLWIDEGLSFSEIAGRLGERVGYRITRSTVAGKIRRLGLLGKGGSPRPEPTRILLLVPDPPEPGTYRLADLDSNQCRFACTPHDASPEDHRFCGAPTRNQAGNLHGSYCDAHLTIVWGRGTASERRAGEYEDVRRVA